MPGDRTGKIARAIRITATVSATGKASRTAALKGPQRTVDLHVPDARQFRMFAMGDQVQATYTEAVAISLEPAAKK